jgi:hypothetical protein
MRYDIKIETYGWERPLIDDVFYAGWGLEQEEWIKGMTEDDVGRWSARLINGNRGAEFVRNINTLGDGCWKTHITKGLDNLRKEIWFTVTPREKNL